MASKLNPYLNFDGTAREAMEFSQSVLGGDLHFTTFGEFGMEGEGADGIMHSTLTTAAGYTLMASDTPPGMPADSGSTVTLSISGDDDEELRGYFAGLAEGGTIGMPLEKQAWGDVFGMLTDKFGKQWMVDIVNH